MPAHYKCCNIYSTRANPYAQGDQSTPPAPCQAAVGICRCCHWASNNNGTQQPHTPHSLWRLPHTNPVYDANAGADNHMCTHTIHRAFSALAGAPSFRRDQQSAPSQLYARQMWWQRAEHARACTPQEIKRRRILRPCHHACVCTYIAQPPTGRVWCELKHQGGQRRGRHTLLLLLLLLGVSAAGAWHRTGPPVGTANNSAAWQTDAPASPHASPLQTTTDPNLWPSTRRAKHRLPAACSTSPSRCLLLPPPAAGHCQLMPAPVRSCWLAASRSTT